jgi:hypothetical protein
MVSCYNSTANTKYEVVYTKHYSNQALQKKKKIKLKSTWLLDIGDGNIKAITKEKEDEPCLLLRKDDKISCVVNTTFSDLHTNFADVQYIKD